MKPRLGAHTKPALMLVLATVCWGLSFPVMRAMGLGQQRLLPEVSSWYVSSLCVSIRFALAASIMVVWSARTLRGITRLELWQGLGLGVFGSAGLILQMDGLAYTTASVSAFLTQCYCVIIPIWVACTERRWPSRWVVLSCALVVYGVAILSGLDWRTMRVGRGESETLLASVMFTGQILWLQRLKFTRNNVNHFSVVMFVVMALCALAAALVSQHEPGDWLRAYAPPVYWGFMAILVIFSTIGGYMLMNHWQPRVTATEAGLIYCAEPLFASLSALFLPGWFSQLASIDYPNETWTLNLLLGGGLITLANLLIQMRPNGGKH